MHTLEAELANEARKHEETATEVKRLSIKVALMRAPVQNVLIKRLSKVLAEDEESRYLSVIATAKALLKDAIDKLEKDDKAAHHAEEAVAALEAKIAVSEAVREWLSAEPATAEEAKAAEVAGRPKSQRGQTTDAGHDMRACLEQTGNDMQAQGACREAAKDAIRTAIGGRNVIQADVDRAFGAVAIIEAENKLCDCDQKAKDDKARQTCMTSTDAKQALATATRIDLTNITDADVMSAALDDAKRAAGEEIETCVTEALNDATKLEDPAIDPESEVTPP